MYSTIRITSEQKEILKDLKIHKNQSYSEVIGNLIKEEEQSPSP